MNNKGSCTFPTAHWSIASLPAVNAEHETRVNEGEEEMKHEADEEELADLEACKGIKILF